MAVVLNVYFSLGSNLGDREKNIYEALRRMDEAFGRHYETLSQLVETVPVGFSGGKFLNCAVLYRISSSHPAMEVLEKVKSVERAMGRTDPPEYDADGGRIYHSRIIDIDILFYGKERMDTPLLTIPHKGIADREFVLVPLREIARPSLRRAFPEYFRKR
ncbi:MAG: 2-amino-4-hydroxy-6-hydroxymethyldihydropteridine diphosphokinase [Bacteroidales bacterium]|nr:2-amino-4-hydroxy-6-hydroxymethyldihydropteridine diphosphokinase [Bacteroidales bacterium]